MSAAPEPLQEPNPKKTPPRTAFTLAELLVVVAIIALLVALAAPGLRQARRAASVAVCRSNLHQVSHAFIMYTSDFADRYPAAQDPVSTSPFYWLWMGRGFRDYIGPYLVKDINAENPSVLVCPNDRTPASTFERTSYAYSMAFYHSPEQINSMSDPADNYSNAQPPVAQTASNVRTPGGKILCGEWNSNHWPVLDDNGWWNERGRRVFLFADGHAEDWRADAIIPANDGLPNPNATSNGIRGVDVY